MSISDSSPIWFIQTAWSVTWPFLALALIASAVTAVHDFLERGFRRRGERLHGGRR